ncbi:Molybdopterin-guanine dinucleotide biosynthesis protein A [Paraoerskovia marina]|uniref:Molybdopterin-guanine dinucleotide biosynthesis protein A n=1 Tax=Paraoerskovia marina TaxID=545619 RepID=A0A1H1VZ61_9CELL|nr:NTP transferase domain-containing protein [Paraoerskovia marina]SDS90157.1 Molybdopterin-guanine dinucleotide biosynthesis protein A [Paraoerskovia marina]
MTGPRYDALVLAGGRAARLGTPKPDVVVVGRPLLDHVLTATTGADQTVVVGPPHLARPGLSVVREEPAFGGPVAGIDAGLAALASLASRRPTAGPSAAPAWVLLLACDVPRAAGAVPVLLEVASGLAPTEDGVHLRREGRGQWLVGLYRHAALAAALDDLRSGAGSVHGMPVRHVIERLRCRALEDPADLSDDVDTWDDVERLDPGATRPVPEEPQ